MLPGETYAVSLDGKRVVSESLGVFAGAGNDVLNESFGAQYESTREGAGWVTHAITPPAGAYTTGKLVDTSADAASSLWFLHKSGQPYEVEELYLRRPEGIFTRVGPGDAGFSEATNRPLSLAFHGEKVTYVGASPNLSHVLVSASSSSFYSLWQGDTSVTAGAVESLYEYTGTNNTEPTLVGVSNAGRLGGRSYVNEGAKLISNCGTVLGGREGSASGTTMYNAISESGTTVFFTSAGQGESPQCQAAGARYQTCEEEGNTRKECEERTVPEPLGPPPSGPLVNEVYARVNGETTVDISEPSFSVPGRECTGLCETYEKTESLRSEGVFEGASQDGSKVFFTTEQPLVNADKDVPNGVEDHAKNLYEAELGTVEEGGKSQVGIKRLVMISEGEAGDPSPGMGAEVQGVVRISEDGSHVYFVAKGKLTSSPNARREEAQPGNDNLYVFDTGSERISFIGALNGNTDSELWHHSQFKGAVEATPDGQFLVFTSGADLTSDDTSSEAAPQIFEYDAVSGSLTRVSIGQRGSYRCPSSGTIEEGYNCNGNTDNTEEAPTMQFPSYISSDYVRTATSSLTVSNNGSTIVFESRDSLTPLATAGDMNVYEYREGNVYLISDGHDATEVSSVGVHKLLNIDGTGEDIFFATGDQLVPQDVDSEVDFYDARIDGGFPGPSSSPGCVEDCQGEPSATPVFLSPDGSENTVGEMSGAPPVTPRVTKGSGLTRAKRLMKALARCRTLSRKIIRICESAARKRYGKDSKTMRDRRHR